MIRFLTKSKYGGIDLPLSNLVGLVFAGIVVAGMFLTFDELHAAVLTKPDDGTLANFNELYGVIKEMVESDQEDTYKIINYFVGEKKFIVGFDTNWNPENEIYNGWAYKKVYRPFECGTSACLCVYEEDNSWNDPNNRGEGLIDCHSDGLDKTTIVFAGEAGVSPKTEGLSRNDETKKNYLILSEDFGVQRLYVEKSKLPDKSATMIYVSAIDTDDQNHPALIRSGQMSLFEPE